MSARDYYAVLKVARTATNLEIKTAYRKIALAVHPDVSKKGDMVRVTTKFAMTEITCGCCHTVLLLIFAEFCIWLDVHSASQR